MRCDRTGRAGFPNQIQLALAALTALALAGCSQAPGKKSKEYFPSSVYGAASPKVVGDGDAVPKGGGRYLVGKPYTVAGRTYTPKEVSANTSQTGKASWYGSAFHGRRTSNGEVYDMRSVTAAHPTWPLPSYVRVTNMANGRSMIVRLNDRGPFHSDRIMDVSSRVADALDFKRMGTANIKVDYVKPAGLGGSDDVILMATLRDDGKPATLDGTPQGSPVMVAEAEEKPAREEKTVAVASLFSRSEPAPQPVRTAPQSAVTDALEEIDDEDIVPLLPVRRPVALGLLPGARPVPLVPPVQMAQAAPPVTAPAPIASPQLTTIPKAAPVVSASYMPLPPARPLSLGSIR
jgi:rare lipoprotein A